MSIFLEILNDTDLEVRKACLLMVNAATHHYPDIIIPFLENQVKEEIMYMYVYLFIFYLMINLFIYLFEI